MEDKTAVDVLNGATAGEAEAMFDKAVDALREVYGAPMAAAILDGRAHLATKEINDSLGWSPAVQKAMSRFDAALAKRCAEPDLLSALKRIKAMPGPVIDGPSGSAKFLAYDAVVEIIDAAISRASR